MTKPKFHLVLFSLIVIATFLGFLHSATLKVDASAITGFSAGNIIDDYVFTNKRTMSASQIQSFLNSKVPKCDTNGTKTSEYGGGTRAEYGKVHGNPPPYICLKNYTQGGKSAARIIYDTAQEFRINPQVLIVLLQKEQRLVTDDWPWKIQYKSATGYGCPDTAACNTKYYGFTNQVRNAANMFRRIMNEDADWYTPYSLGNNKIYWHPDLTRCGSSTVNIQNLATVALYSYTPYRPNKAALDAGYGIGNSCSSYGNRNFYLYFKDWFGSVRGKNTPYRLISCATNKYLVESGIRKKRHLSDESIASWGFTNSTYSAEDIGCSYPEYSLPLGRYVRSRTTKKFYITDTERAFNVQSSTAASAWGVTDIYTSDYTQIPQVNGDVLNYRLDIYDKIPYLAKSPSTAKTYLFDSGKRYEAFGSPSNTGSLRLIQGDKALASAVFSVDLIQTLVDGGDINFAFTIGPAWYMFDYGKLRQISDDHLYRWENILTGPNLSSGVLKLLPLKEPFTWGFRRDNVNYRVTSTGEIQSTTNTNTWSWGVNGTPYITNLLRNKLVN